MNDSEKPKFAQSMAAIGEIYGKDISEVTYRASFGFRLQQVFVYIREVR